jgi:Arm DNA-binding domain
MYRVAGAGSRLRKYTIGPYGRVTLAMARAQAQKIFAARLDGRDPAEEKKQSRRRLVVDRIDDLVETFIRERVSQIRTARRITNLFRRDVIAIGAQRAFTRSRNVTLLILSLRSRSVMRTPAIGCSKP